MPSSAEVVELDLPLSTRHASTARVVAASLAADAGFTVDEIDDLRLGLNEAVSVVADAGGDAGGRLQLRFEVSGTRISIEATRSGGAAVALTDGPDELARRILAAVVDEFSYDGERFVITKSSVGAPALDAGSGAPR